MNPGSTLYVGTTNLVPGNATVRYASASAQQADILPRLTHVFSNLLFIRAEQGWVQVQGYTPDLFNCNYLAFKNAGDDKWYYAFVVLVEYVNESTARIDFQLDLMQTYMFDYARTAQFVAREHVNDDTIGANLTDEPVSTGELKALHVWKSMHDFTGQPFPLDEFTAFAFAANDENGNDANPGVLDGTPTGVGVFYSPLPIDEDGKMYTDGLGTWLHQMNSEGKSDSIVGIVLYPMWLCQDLGTTADETMNQLFDATGNSSYVSQTHYFSPTRTTDIDGYVPHNNKLFTYPYTFLRATNLNGQYADWRYELFTPSATGSFTLTVSGTIAQDGEVFMAPFNYNGVQGSNWGEKIGMGGLIQVPWANDAFTSYAAQNKASIALSLVGAAISLIPAGRVAATAVKAGLMAASGAASGTSIAGATAFGARVALDAGTRAAAGTGAGASLMAASQTVAGLLDQTRVPDKQQGQASGAALNGIQSKGFWLMQMGCRAEFARIADQYFDMFGYAVNEVKVPNETGRANWNYVETQNCSFHGSVPATYMKQINAMYDTGITFWHSMEAIGNYGLDNSIV